MYSVVGCSECQALWTVADRPETTQCPRCRTRHRFAKLKAFAETETSEAAARVRSSMLAKRADDGEFVDPGEIDLDGVGVSDEEYLSAAGVDVDAVADAERRTRTSSGDSRSRREVVLDALRELDEPTVEHVRRYATDAGVHESDVDRALEKLRRTGEVTVTEGVYRLL